MNQAYSVLVVDDERQNRQLLAELLKDDCQVILAKNGVQALERVHAQRPDLILLDVLMPEMDGYEVIRQLHARDDSRQIPVIFISALDSPNDEEKGLDLGAVDYISKPFHPPIVRKRVRNHLQLVHQRRLLERLAQIDFLTEIPNRRRFIEMLDVEWRRCARNQAPLSLAVIDVDHFKLYNDQCGHQAGDHVLVQVAEALSFQGDHAGELVARYGGEEFVWLMPDVPARLAGERARALCQYIHDLAIPHPVSPVSPVITVSVGGITIHPAGCEPAVDFFTQADAMLYQAKHQGRNRSLWAD